MPFGTATRSTYFVFTSQEILQAQKEGDPKIIKGKMACSFLLEDQIYQTLELKRFSVYNLENDGAFLYKVTPLNFSSRTDLVKAGIVVEWKISFKIASINTRTAGFPAIFKTSFVAPASFLKVDLIPFFARDFFVTIGDQPYKYIDGSLKKVGGRGK